MNAREKKLIALGTAAGILTAALVVGILAVRERPSFASGPASPAGSATPSTPPDSQSGTQPGATVQLSPAEITAAGVQVAEVRTASLKTDIAAFGRVEQPEAQLAAVSTRIGGRLDKLHVQYTGERVQRGQAVAEVYSPEVATALEEFRLAEENRNQLRQSDEVYARQQADALVEASRRKLELWGINGKQIGAPETSGVPHVTIYAYASGTVVDRKVTQGQYVNAGDTLFTVADLSQVWIKADVYEEQLPQIRLGQAVDITAESLPNRTVHGRVDFIEPSANPQTRTVPVHVHVANPGMRLLPGMFVNATFVSSTAQPSIVVPRSAVLDTGTRKIVYLARPNGVFEAREVQLGAPAEDLFPVSSGLALGDKVVLNGNFLIDSQAHLSSGMSGLYGGSKEFSAGQSASAAAAGKTADANAAKIEFHADADPLKAGADNPFHVNLTDAGGKPIGDAQVTVTLIMPAMPAMSMPEMKSSFALPWMASRQMYVGKGQPPMAGSLNVLVEARRNGGVIATFHTHLGAR
ncbi:MAG: efflux RND transporter periplasmic adaptor subunit [Terracidiphilus sp.]|nr:efflux RND transporter periplasmic adaptor subunit [Terracidiphilus sp.]